MIIGLVASSVLLAIFSVYPVNRGSDLRPQSVQVAREALEPPQLDQAPTPAGSISQTTNQPSPSPEDSPISQPAIAGSSDSSPQPIVKQTINKTITDDSVKLRVEQQVRTNQSVNNKIKIKVDTGQEPPLVEIETQPNPAD